MLEDKKQNYYLDVIMKIARYGPDTEEKSKRLSSLLTKYEKYCYKKKIESFNEISLKKVYYPLENLSFIIESKPEIFELDEQEVKEAWNHLLYVLDNGGGISSEEAKLLLDWSVQKARLVLGRNINILNDSLNGSCGYSQMLTLIPFIKAGVKTTINNAKFFTKNGPAHSFGTVTFPIEENEKIIDKQFLIDATYRQFFTTLRCNEGRYYSSRFPGRVSPDSGYYMIKYLDGRNIATEILKKGYIELTEEVLKKYASSFIAERLNIYNRRKIFEIIKNVNYYDLKRILEEKQEEFDYDEEDIEDALKEVDFPISSYQL